MKIRRILSFFALLFPVPLWAATSVSPATITTGLRWDNIANGLYSYIGTTVTVTGSNCTSSSPCTWTLKDQNGTTVTTLSASGGKTAGWPSTGATPPSNSAVFGQIDCTNSAANSTCVYNAPGEYPPGETATINVSDGSTNANVTVAFTFAFSLQEYWKHRARMLTQESKPLATLCAGTPTICQPEWLIAQSGSTAFSELQIPQDDNDVIGAEFPTTAGSDINRPAWTYDGKWFSWSGDRCEAGVGCGGGGTIKWIGQTNGNGLQIIYGPGGGNYIPLGYNYTYDFNKPNLLVTSDSSNIKVLDLNKANMLTNVASYSDTRTLATYSQVGGANNSQFQFREPNAGTCSPIQQSCSVQVTTYDLTSCESSLVSGCATIAGTWNSYLQLSGYYDLSGNPHCTIDGGGNNCEYHFHDIYLRRGTSNSVWLYGPFGDVGEYIGFMTGLNGTGTVSLYPNTSTNANYFSHPAFDWAGNLVAFSGAPICTPSGHTCTNGTVGEGVWDIRQNKTVAYANGAAYGHSAWDGFSDNYYAHDGAVTINGKRHVVLSSSYVNFSGSGSVTDTLVFDFGRQDQDSTGNHSAVSGLYSPVQSPDATKIAEGEPTSMSGANQLLGWIAVVNTPQPPVSLGLTTSSADTLGWYADPLNHETQAYHIYRQAGCSGAWSRVADVSAVYLQSTEYTWTDASSPASGSSACYGISSSEWDGIEGNLLSGVIQVTNTSGTYSYTANPGAGTINFDITAPGSPSGLSATLGRISLPSGAASNMAASTGGSLAAGTYWFKYAYCNFADYPADTAANLKCTAPSAGASISVSGSNDAVLFDNGRNDAFGQTAIEVFGCGPSSTECTETLQSCSLVNSSAFSSQPVSGGGTAVVWTFPPDWSPGRLRGSGSGAATCKINSISAGAALPVSNASEMGYSLAWTRSADDGAGANDVRYYAIYSQDTAAPVLSQGAYPAQQYLIATMPAGSASYLDYLPNWYRIYNASGGPYYGIVAVDRLGNRSAPVCLRADTNSTVACN